MPDKFITSFVDRFSNGMYDSHAYDKFVATYLMLKNKFPSFEIIPKESSRLMRILSRILFFNKRFMSGYITTIGYKVYVPKDSITPSLWVTLLHEGQHMNQNSRSFLFPVLYLFPQILGLLSLLSLGAVFASNYWLLNLLWLLAVLPWPAYFRMSYEVGAYTVNMVANNDVVSQGSNPGAWWAPQFTSSAYYFMWPFKRNVEKRLAKSYKNVDSVLDRATLNILRN